MIALQVHPAMAALCALGWMVLACAIPLLRLQWRQPCMCLLVGTGVPLLGWLTYICGPGFGVLFLALGLSVLVWQPLEALQRRRRGPSGPEVQ